MRRGLLLALSAVGLLLAVGSAAAAPGVLDPSFGAGSGEVTTQIGESAAADAVVVQPDGKIVAAGEFVEAIGPPNFALVRYEPSGTLDPTFGNGGWVLSPAGAASAVALQPDGKIVAAGTASNQIRVVRYNADGSLDQSFGTGGVVTTAASGSGSVANALVLQPDGKIVVGGYSSDGLERLFTLVRYDANGSLDSTFGSGGIVTTRVGTGSSSIDGLVLQPDGKFVADGDAVDAADQNVPGLARYNADGSLDPSFGSGGIVTTPVTPGGFFPYDASGGPLALQPDGKIVVAATSQGAWFLVRYETDGSLDPSFVSGGLATIGGDSPGASSLVLQPDGKILTAGFDSTATSPTGPVTDLLTIARMNPDGTLDRTFSTGGVADIEAGTGAPNSPPPASAALALQPDGKIVAAGSQSDATHSTQQFLVARFGASTVTVDLGNSSMGAGGEITSSPAGIDCGSSLSCFYPGFFGWAHAFAAGPVTLTATPDDGWHFAGWSGDGCSGTGTCQVQMSGDPADDQQVTASFVLDPATLVVIKTGNGAGSVTSNPAGIDCGPECSHVFDGGPMVTLTAHAAHGSRFIGWSGRGCSGTRDCEVTMIGSHSVEARFQGFCIVPGVKGETLRAAEKNIRKARCRTGEIGHSYSRVARGHVVSQRPRAKRKLPSGTKVDLVVSKGKRPLP